MGIGMNLSNAIGNSGFANKVSSNLETLDNIRLYNMPPSKRADVMWRRNRLSQIMGGKEIYSPAEVYQAQFAPYIR